MRTGAISARSRCRVCWPVGMSRCNLRPPTSTSLISRGTRGPRPRICLHRLRGAPARAFGARLPWLSWLARRREHDGELPPIDVSARIATSRFASHGDLKLLNRQGHRFKERARIHDAILLAGQQRERRKPEEVMTKTRCHGPTRLQRNQIAVCRVAANNSMTVRNGVSVRRVRRPRRLASAAARATSGSGRDD